VQGRSVQERHHNFAYRADNRRRILQRHLVGMVEMQRIGLLHDVVQQIAVVVKGAFRRPGRAGCVDDEGEIVRRGAMARLEAGDTAERIDIDRWEIVRK